MATDWFANSGHADGVDGSCHRKNGRTGGRGSRRSRQSTCPGPFLKSDMPDDGSAPVLFLKSSMLRTLTFRLLPRVCLPSRTGPLFAMTKIAPLVKHTIVKKRTKSFER